MTRAEVITLMLRAGLDGAAADMSYIRACELLIAQYEWELRSDAADLARRWAKECEGGL